MIRPDMINAEWRTAIVGDVQLFETVASRNGNGSADRSSPKMLKGK